LANVMAGAAGAVTGRALGVLGARVLEYVIMLSEKLGRSRRR